MQQDLGGTIRWLRQQKGITLQTLAARTGLSKGYISKLERGHKTPPISTLSRIAVALGVEVSAFFEKGAAESACTLVRASQRLPVSRGESTFGYHYEAIAHLRQRKSMEPFIITLVPHARDKTVFSHEGEELMFVLQGRMLFICGEQSYVCGPGDCLYFDSSIPHRGECLGDEEAKVLVVILPGSAGGASRQ